MIETTRTLDPFEVEDLDAATLLAHAAEAEHQLRVAERRRLRLVAQWCVLHPATEDTGVAAWGGAMIADLGAGESVGGEGTPALAAFAAEPLAAALGVSPAAALGLCADVLDLRHRLPHLWHQVETLAVPAWKARRVAEMTRALSLEAARWMDDRLASSAGRWGWRRLEEMLAHAVATFHPDRVEAHHRRGRHGWDVQLRHEADLDTGLVGTSHLTATGDTLDLSRFHELVCDVAAQLGALGDPDPLGARKAKALGVIAGQQATLDLNASEVAPQTHAAAGPRPARATRTHLYLHLSLAELALLAPGAACSGSEARATGVGWVERLGPVSLAQVREWVGHSQVRVTGVVDLSATSSAVDPHDPPEWMRELVVLRDQHCVFPGCTRDARRCDLDHIVPYDPDGPPGQTNPANLAALCRRHHRAKTGRRWRYLRHADGAYEWTSPHGRRYLVLREGTLPLDPDS